MASVKTGSNDGGFQDTDWREGRDDWFDGCPEARNRMFCLCSHIEILCVQGWSLTVVALSIFAGLPEGSGMGKSRPERSGQHLGQ